MKLVIAEKNIAAQKIAQLLATGKPKNDKVYNTPVYRFDVEGEEWVSMGLAGHILAPDFPDEILFDKKEGWYSLTEDGEVLNAQVPDGLARPPYDTKRKPFLANGINIKGWKVESLPYLTWAPIIKNPAEKEIIRVLKNLAKKADSVVIATDFDREGELIGSDALSCVREVAPDVPVSRARYSALIKGEVTEAFNNLVELDQNLADAGFSVSNIGVNAEGISLGQAGTSSISRTWTEGTALKNGFTFDFNLVLGDGAANGWNLSDQFSVSLGNGSFYGTLNINEAYIKWGDTILYSLDMSANTENLRMAYVTGNEQEGLKGGYYVWLGDMLIGEALSVTSGSGSNGVIIQYDGNGNAILKDLSMDGTGSYAPPTSGLVNEENAFISAGADSGRF